MRPIRLEMNAFGPYEKLCVIDFSEFSDGKIFLITGNTGAGKTSIFDAISFALYGSPSGNIRKANMLRNANAKVSDKTYVTLTFEYLNKQYTITRNPSYERLKKSGEGTTIQNADATLTLDTGEIISGISLVDEKIFELLKINQNQFSQIVMIAQNDFLKFLSSNTSDRVSILRTIFNTNFYLKFENELKSDTNKQKNILDNLLSEYRFHLKQVLSDEDSHINHKNIIVKINELIKENKKLIKEFKIKLDASEKEINKLNKELTTSKLHNKQIETFNTYKNNFDILNKKIDEIKSKEKKLDKLNIIEKNLLSIDKNYESTKNDFKIIQNEIVKINNSLKSNKDKIKDNELEKLKIDDFKVEIEKLKESNVLLNKQIPIFRNIDIIDKEITIVINNLNIYNYNILYFLNDLNLKLNNKNTNYQKQLEEYNKLNESFLEISNKYLHLEALFLDNQAALLASKLKANKPCPVCGSLNHPDLSKLTHENIEFEYFEAKNLYNKLDSEKRELSSKLESFKSELKDNENNYNNYLNSYFNSLDINIKQLLKESSKQELLNKNIKELLEVKKTLDISLNDLNIKKEALSSDLKFESLRQLEKEISKNNEIIKSKNAEVEKILNLAAKLSDEKISLSSSLKNYQKQEENTNNKLIEIKENLNSLISKYFESEEIYNNYKLELNTLDILSKEIKSFNEDFTKAKSLYEEYLNITKDLVYRDTKEMEISIDNLNISLKESNTNLNKLNNDNDKYENTLDKLNSLDEKA